MATGLKSLADDGVVNFYNTVANLPAEGFSNATSLFQSLSDIGNIPKTGGVAQWFSGENDFAGLAEKLPGFGEAMASFYSSIAGITDFTKISQLFQALAGIGEAFPNTGGLGQLFTGENDITGVGAQLKQFGADTKAFFTQVNSLDTTKLASLWDSIKRAGEVASSNLSGLASAGTNLTNFMNNVKGFFTGAGEIAGQIEAVNSVAAALQNFFSIIQGIVTTSLTGINSGLSDMVTYVTNSTAKFEALGRSMTLFSNVAKTAFNSMVKLAVACMNKINSAFKSGFSRALSITRSGLNSIKSAISSTNLSSAGVQMLNGLIRGMNSLRSAAISTARSIAQAINAEFDKVQKINSPSKVWEDKGAFMMQGGIIGMEKTLPEFQQTAETAGSMAMPYLDRYTPENTSTYTSTRNAEYNTYAPQFSFSISGTNDDRAIARKVKRAVVEAWEDMLSGYESKIPVTREV